MVLDDTSCFQTSDHLPRFVFIQAYSCPGVPDSHETYIPAKTITNTKELIFPNTMVSTRTHTHTHTHTKTEVTANQLTKTRECAMGVIGLKAEYFWNMSKAGEPHFTTMVPRISGTKSCWKVAKILPKTRFSGFGCSNLQKTCFRDTLCIKLNFWTIGNFFAKILCVGIAKPIFSV